LPTLFVENRGQKYGSIQIKNSKLHTRAKSIVPEYQEGYLNSILK